MVNDIDVEVYLDVQILLKGPSEDGLTTRVPDVLPLSLALEIGHRVGRPRGSRRTARSVAEKCAVTLTRRARLSKY